MSELFTADPVVVAFTSETQFRSVQFYVQAMHPARKVPSWYTAAQVTRGAFGVSLQISEDCPESWVERVVAAYWLVRSGGMPDGTHSIDWVMADWGITPEFTPLDVTTEGTL